MKPFVDISDVGDDGDKFRIKDMLFKIELKNGGHLTLSDELNGRGIAIIVEGIFRRPTVDFYIDLKEPCKLIWNGGFDLTKDHELRIYIYSEQTVGMMEERLFVPPILQDAALKKINFGKKRRPKKD